MDAVRDFLIATLKYCPVWIPTGVVLWSFGKDWLDRISGHFDPDAGFWEEG
jgi:hypothetical protein